MPSSQITVGSLIQIARGAGWDASRWTRRALPPPPPPPTVHGFDPNAFDVAKRWNNIPRRDWIMKPILIAKHYSMLVATGASGKSATSISLALALVTGRNDILQMHVDRPCKVMIINGEDGPEEMMRRVRAACQYFDINLSDVAGRLAIVGAREIPGLTFNRVDRGGVTADEAGLGVLEDMIRKFGADVVLLDPLGAFLPGGTNDGASASAVAGRLTEICVKSNCALHNLVLREQIPFRFEGRFSAED